MTRVNWDLYSTARSIELDWSRIAVAAQVLWAVNNRPSALLGFANQILLNHISFHVSKAGWN